MSPDDPCVTRTRRRGRARHRRSKEITEDVLSRLSREGVKRVSHLPASVKRGANVRFFLWVSCLLIRVQEDVFERRGGRFSMAPALTSWTNMGTWFSSIFNVSPRQLRKLLELYCILCFRPRRKCKRQNANQEENIWQTNIAVCLGFVMKSDMLNNSGTKCSLALK